MEAKAISRETERGNSGSETAKGINQHKGILQTLIGSTYEFITNRLDYEYGSYMAPNTLSSGCPRNTEWNRCSDEGWREILNALEAEAKKKDHWRAVKKRSSNPPGLDEFINPVPCTPYTKIVAMAASNLGITPEQMIFEIGDYLARKQPSHRNIQHLIKTCSWIELSQRLIQDKNIIDRAFGDSPHEADTLKTIISRIENQWFVPVSADGLNTINVLSQEAMDKTILDQAKRFKMHFSKVKQ